MGFLEVINNDLAENREFRFRWAFPRFRPGFRDRGKSVPLKVEEMNLHTFIMQITEFFQNKYLHIDNK